MARITRSVRIEEELDHKLRKLTYDDFRLSSRHGAFSDIVNAALLAWLEAYARNASTPKED